MYLLNIFNESEDIDQRPLAYQQVPLKSSEVINQQKTMFSGSEKNEAFVIKICNL